MPKAWSRAGEDEARGETAATGSGQGRRSKAEPSGEGRGGGAAWRHFRERALRAKNQGEVTLHVTLAPLGPPLNGEQVRLWLP